MTAKKRLRGVVLSIRLTPEELEFLQEHARAAGHSTISGYVRDRALGRVPVATYRCAHASISGAFVGAPSVGCGCAMRREPAASATLNGTFKWKA